MAGVLDSVLNAAQLYALKHRLDAMRAATAEEENTKRFLAERLNMGTAGQPIDVGGLPSASVLASMYDEQQLRDRSGAIAQKRRDDAQSAADRLVQRGLLKFMEPEQIVGWLSMGVDIPEDQLPVYFKNPNPGDLQDMFGGALGPEQAQAFGNVPWSIAKTMLGNVPIQTKAPAFTVQQLEQIPGFATMPEVHKAAMRASVAATGKAPGEDAWRGAMVPKPEKQVEHLTPEMIDGLEQTKQITGEEAAMLRTVGGDMQLARESIRSRWDGRLPNAAKAKIFEMDIEAAKEDLARATEAHKAAELDDEKTAADAQVKSAQAALKDARAKYKAFLEKQASVAPSQDGDVRSQMVDLATQMRDMGMNEEAIKAQLRKRFGKGQP